MTLNIMRSLPNFSKIKKRDSSIAEYDRKKLYKAIQKASKAVGKRKKELYRCWIVAQFK